MAKDIFRIDACGKNGLYYDFCLPMTPYELLDTLYVLGMSAEDTPTVEVTNCGRFPKLRPFVNGESSLYELNALAEALSRLDGTQRTAFDGLLQMEAAKNESFGLGRLIDLAHSVDCCLVLTEVRDDAALGRFYAENGFVREAEDISDEIFELLDFKRIGKEMRQGEDGVFTAGGYVIRHSGLAEVYKNMELTPKVPDYAVAVKLSRDGNSVTLKLPAEIRDMSAALAALNIQYWREAEVSCLDCRAPLLLNAISGYDGTLTELNSFARKLTDMDSTHLVKFKAVLEATEEQSMPGAVNIAGKLDEYTLDPQQTTPEEVAEDFIRSRMGHSAAQTLLPFVNLTVYGNTLVREQGSVITNYGCVSREDGQPVWDMAEQPSQGMGMM